LLHQGLLPVRGTRHGGGQGKRGHGQATRPGFGRNSPLNLPRACRIRFLSSANEWDQFRGGESGCVTLPVVDFLRLLMVSKGLSGGLSFGADLGRETMCRLGSVGQLSIWLKARIRACKTALAPEQG